MVVIQSRNLSRITTKIRKGNQNQTSKNGTHIWMGRQIDICTGENKYPKDKIHRWYNNRTSLINLGRLRLTLIFH